MLQPPVHVLSYYSFCEIILLLALLLYSINLSTSEMYTLISHRYITFHFIYSKYKGEIGLTFDSQNLTKRSPAETDLLPQTLEVSKRFGVFSVQLSGTGAVVAWTNFFVGWDRPFGFSVCPTFRRRNKNARDTTVFPKLTRENRSIAVGIKTRRA